MERSSTLSVEDLKLQYNTLRKLFSAAKFYARESGKPVVFHVQNGHQSTIELGPDTNISLLAETIMTPRHVIAGHRSNNFIKAIAESKVDDMQHGYPEVRDAEVAKAFFSASLRDVVTYLSAHTEVHGITIDGKNLSLQGVKSEALKNIVSEWLRSIYDDISQARKMRSESTTADIQRHFNNHLTLLQAGVTNENLFTLIREVNLVRDLYKHPDLSEDHRQQFSRALERTADILGNLTSDQEDDIARLPVISLLSELCVSYARSEIPTTEALRSAWDKGEQEAMSRSILSDSLKASLGQIRANPENSWELLNNLLTVAQDEQQKGNARNRRLILQTMLSVVAEMKGAEWRVPETANQPVLFDDLIKKINAAIATDSPEFEKLRSACGAVSSVYTKTLETIKLRLQEVYLSALEKKDYFDFLSRQIDLLANKRLTFEITSVPSLYHIALRQFLESIEQVAGTEGKPPTQEIQDRAQFAHRLALEMHRYLTGDFINSDLFGISPQQRREVYELYPKNTGPLPVVEAVTSRLTSSSVLTLRGASLLL